MIAQWPIIVKNHEIYVKRESETCLVVLRKKSLKQFGQIAQIAPSTPVRHSLRYALNKFKWSRRRSPTTWLWIMKKQINEELNMDWNEALNIAKDKSVWKTLIKNFSM